MSNETKTEAPAEKSAISPVADDTAFETGDVSKIDAKADPALALVAGEVIEFSDAEGSSVLSKIVCNYNLAI